MGAFLQQEIENQTKNPNALVPNNLIIATIILALSAGFVSSIGFGLLGPLFALRMNDLGLSPSIIGLLVTITGIAPLLLTPYLPHILHHFDVFKALMIAVLLNALLYFALTIKTDPIVWTIVRIGFSLSGTFLFIAAESVILEMAPPKYRGRILGFYAIIFYGGIGIGGLLISKLSYQANSVIYIAFALNLLVLPFFALKTQKAARPNIDGQSFLSVYKLLMQNIAIFMPAFAIGGLETAAFNIFPIWVRLEGFGDNLAGLILGAAAIGNILLQAPLGYLADKIGYKKTITLIAIFAFIGPIALIYAKSEIMILLVVCLWSGFITGFYTLGLFGLAINFSAQRIAIANAAFGTTYCIAQIFTPSLGGMLLDEFGGAYFMLSLAIIGLFPLIMLLFDKNTEKHS
jgi:MFS family permease